MGLMCAHIPHAVGLLAVRRAFDTVDIRRHEPTDDVMKKSIVFALALLMPTVLSQAPALAHTDIRHFGLLPKCRAEAIPGAEVNAGTLLNVSQLAWPDMAIEIDVIAVTAK
jgi:hypothetical protein